MTWPAWTIEPEFIVAYRDFQDNLLGPDPLAEGGHKWPAWTATEARKVRADRPLRGWRMWSVVDTAAGPRLIAPFITSVLGESPDVDGLTWAPGKNTSTTAMRCGGAAGHHPLVGCRCGLRIMQSLTALRAFATEYEDRIGPMVAYAEVDVWGKVAPFAPDDDWRYTLRAEFAQIVGPLQLAPSHATHADALAAHYGIDVIIDPPACAHFGQYGAAGLLVVDQGNVLLQLRPEGVHEGGTWSIPGGARNDGESPEDAALREAHEEAGIDPDDIEMLAYYTHPCECGWDYVTCIATLTGTLELAGNWESQELRWVPLEEVETLPLHHGLQDAWPDLRDLVDAQDTDPNISQVTDRVWTGGDRGNTSPMAWFLQLDQAGITHVIDARPHGGRDQAYARDHAPHINYLLNGQPDNGQTKPDDWFADGVDFALHAMRDPDARVLAHCQLGINRGPSMALAILLAQGMEPDAALSAIHESRPIAQIAYADDAIDWWTRTTT